MKDLFDKCDAFLNGSNGLAAEDREIVADVLGEVSPVPNAGPWISSNGMRMLQFSSNDYLGLAMHPEVRECAERVVHQYGLSQPMGSRAMTGTTAEHLRLERSIAEFKRCPEALVFSTGASAMIGAIACLGSPRDVLLFDQFAHASLVCGARISGATVVTFQHNDLDHLESLLRKYAGRRPMAVVVDGVYSMQGDLAPLPELVQLKQRHGARLIVDDAHGTGVFGPEGRGTAFQFGVEDGIDLHLGTFSKALGTTGGFAAGDHRVITYLRYSAPTLLFTKSLPLAVVAATARALELLQAAESQRKRLWANARSLQNALRARGFDIGTTASPITPVQFAGTQALRVAQRLRREHHIWASPVLFPAVEQGKSILRLTPTANHSPEDIARVVDGLSLAACSQLFSVVA